MPEGPFGFPRLTSIGPLVEDDPTPEELFRDITLKSHSWRNYEPDEFIQLLESDFPKDKIREELDVMESGRFNKMLESAYKFYIHLDLDEKKEFYRRNPDLVRWLEVYGRAEDAYPPSQDIDI